MLENSIRAIDKMIADLEERMNENRQYLQEKKVTSEEAIKRNQKIINDSKTVPVERLRALIMNVIYSNDIMQLHQEQAHLILNKIFATSIRIFQEEVSLELNLHYAKSVLRKSKGEELQKYAEIEKKLQKMKRIMDKEWKPLMDSLKDELDKRKKYLDENR